MQLQDAVEKQIDKPLADGHIPRVEKINDEVFIQPVLVTVKRDKSVKIALEVRSLNNAIQTKKYQMPNSENLLEQIAGIVNSKEDGIVRVTSLDMLYAYRQTALHPETASHCYPQIIGGRATYAFKTGFFGMKTMSPEFQKIMDNICTKFRLTFASIDGILIVTKGNKKNT